MDCRHWLMSLAFTLAACEAAPALTAAPTASLLSMPPATATRSPAAAGSAAPAATPVIIASPTATATPVTHVVQAGETMLGIALDYGVSLDALQAANPNVQARFLSIGTVLVIPPPQGGFAVAATNLAPPPPATVDLSQPVCYTLASSGLYCFVDARNPNERPVENVSARIVLAGADGLPFAGQTAFGALDVIPAGSDVPLAVLFAPAPTQTVAAAGAELLTANMVAEATPGAPSRTVVLTVSAQPGGMQGGQWTVSGSLTNATGPALSSVWVLLTVYDGKGQVAGFRKLALAGGLAANQTRQFTISSDSLAPVVDHDQILAEGRP